MGKPSQNQFLVQSQNIKPATKFNNVLGRKEFSKLLKPIDLIEAMSKIDEALLSWMLTKHFPKERSSFIVGTETKNMLCAECGITTHQIVLKNNDTII